MTLQFISKDSIPAYLALSTDISGGTIAGCSIIGATVFLTDSHTWKVIKSDLQLGDYYLPITLTGDVNVGTVDQGDPGTTAWPVSLESVPSHNVTNMGTFAVQSTNQANSGVDIGDVTINNGSGVNAVNIQDGGNSITIDGSITNISGTITLPTGAATESSLGTLVSNIEDVTNVNVHTSLNEIRTYSHGHVCSENSTSTPLVGNATFMGAWQDTIDYSEVMITIYANQNSATNGMKIWWSADGITADPDPDTFTLTANVSKTWNFPCNRRYVKIEYINGSTLQTIMLLSTLLKRYASKGSSHRLEDSLNSQDDAIVTKSLIAGKTTAAGGAIVDVKVNPSGALTVESSVVSSSLPAGAATLAAQTDGSQVSKILFDPSNMNAFGTLEVSGQTPVFQGDFVYGLNSQIWATPTVSGTGATVDTNSARLRIQSGTGVAGYAYILSRRSVRYRAGQGTMARFTPIFNSAGLADNIQLWGMGNIASNAPYDGYFFGYNGVSFGIAHYNRGVATWYTRTSDWNGDKVDGSTGTSFTYNPSFGTPCMIKYPYLGFGDIEFFIQHPTTARWVLVHTIRYANTVNTTQLSNPTLHFCGFTLNSGNSTNATMYCGSVGIFISGERSFIGNPKWALDSNKSAITTETCLLNIKNCTTYNGVTNRGQIRFNGISFANAAASPSISVLRLKVGATIGGSPSHVAVSGSTADGGVTITSGNSIASFDVAGTTIANGVYVFNISSSNSSGTPFDLTPYNLFLAPGEIMTISGYATSSSTLGVSINWTEDI